MIWKIMTLVLTFVLLICGLQIYLLEQRVEARGEMLQNLQMDMEALSGILSKNAAEMAALRQSATVYEHASRRCASDLEKYQKISTLRQGPRK